MADPDGGWRFSQCFGDKGDVEVTEADIITAVEFDETGDYLATGDRGGRVVLFERNETKKNREYKFYTEFQSHGPEFDYLKSIEIEEKINKIRWCKRQNNAHFLLSTNDKTIKLWKVFEKSIKMVAENYSPAADTAAPVKFPKLVHHETMIAAIPRKIYQNAHGYHINSISVNCDGETYLSADDLRINLWNLEISDQSFNFVDIKPANMEELTEVITAAEFHPFHCNLFAYSSSKGLIKMIDMRQSALCDTHFKMFNEGYGSDSNLFSEIVSSIADVKFSKDGRYILARDYLTLKIWDVNMESKPVQVIPIHDQLRSKLCELYDNDCIFEKFECTFSGDGKSVMSGSYSNYFHIYNRETNDDILLQADKNAFRAKRSGTQKKGLGGVTVPKRTKESVQRDFANLDTLDCGKKILHGSWHPHENTIALAATNNLFLFQAP